VVGVDHLPQPRFPFQFEQADALEVMADISYLRSFEVIHASPPCQRYSPLVNVTDKEKRDRYPDHIPAVRAALKKSKIPYIIENVPGAPLEDPLMLCGEVFGLEVVRHRLFETDLPLFSRGCRHTRGGTVTGKYVAFRRDREYPRRSEREYRTAMRVEWMTTKESRQAIPPAYTRYLGVQTLAVLWPSGYAARRVSARASLQASHRQL